MAQAIISADGKLQIMRHSIVYPTMGPKSVQGAIKNLDSATLGAEIKISFYGESGNLLGDSIGIFKDIAPGEIRLFDVWAERLPNMYEVESYKIDSLRALTDT